MDDETGGKAPSPESRAKVDAARDKRTRLEQMLAEADAELEEVQERRRLLKEALDASDEAGRKLMEDAFDSKGKVTRG